jgi:hypothetical protein
VDFSGAKTSRFLGWQREGCRECQKQSEFGDGSAGYGEIHMRQFSRGLRRCEANSA